MIEPNIPGLSVGKQCSLLSISRSSFYYEPKGESEMNLDLMRVIDKQFFTETLTLYWNTKPPPRQSSHELHHGSVYGES